MILCDGHVHIHDCYPIDAFLSATFDNFTVVSNKACKETEGARFVLWLTESAGMDKFTELLEINGKDKHRSNGIWRVRATQDTISSIAESDRGELILIAGRQIVSAEKIEILALGTREQIADGAPLTETIEQTVSIGALPVVPWGFGKWIGKRGKIVEQVLKTSENLFIGDNGGRIAGFSEPGLFRLARNRHIPILPGTDPLPFPYEYKRVGSYGWLQGGSLNDSRPGESLKDRLRNSRRATSCFGSLQNAGKFIQNQTRMQLHKRLRWIL